jgi:hypothetical protein
MGSLPDEKRDHEALKKLSQLCSTITHKLRAGEKLE